MSHLSFHEGDVLAWADGYSGPKFHALLCDPPYELNFLGNDWDRSGIAFSAATWASLSRHLLPGGFGMAFASTRGYHRMACAIEDAGLIVHPLVVWAFGSGFPKSARFDTAIDAREGIEQPVARERAAGWRDTYVNDGCANDKRWAETEPVSELAKAWAGHRYGLQALKPAIEPVCVFQKPYGRAKALDVICETGAGALNIRGAAIPSEDSTMRVIKRGQGFFGQQEASVLGMVSGCEEGRWPANFMLGDAFAAEALDAQSGFTKSGMMRAGAKASLGGGMFGGGACTSDTYGDEGGASRYFFRAVADELDAADPVCYSPKANRAERDRGLYDRDAQEIGRWGGVGESSGKNTHPCVKPMRLVEHLAKLMLPPDLYSPRRIMVPFSGSGSECIGAMMAGWDEVLGIEMSPDYIALAEERAIHWLRPENVTASKPRPPRRPNFGPLFAGLEA